MNTPNVRTEHAFSYGLYGDNSIITVRLMEGATLIASWAHDPAPGTEVVYNQNITELQAQAIVDYNALELELVAS